MTGRDPSRRFPARAALLATACLLLPLGGCGRKAPAPEAAVPAAAQPTSGAHLPEGIAWFDGEVEAAFAAAKAADKPLFLYWGAEWCPPCAQIKATIFNQREFQERSRLFVPVYLDGDTPSAQKHGEQFGVVGYPTMILFRADGAEITRLPGYVDVERYATILDVALDDARPAAELVDAARKGEVLSQNDWRLLAYHSWEHGRWSHRAGGGAHCDVPAAQRPLPGRARGRLRTTLLRVPLCRGRRDRGRCEAVLRARTRRGARASAHPARQALGAAVERGEPDLWREGHRGPAVGRRLARARRPDRRLDQGARHAGQRRGGHGAVGAGAAETDPCARADREARCPGPAAARAAARPGAPGRRQGGRGKRRTAMRGR